MLVKNRTCSSFLQKAQIFAHGYLKITQQYRVGKNHHHNGNFTVKFHNIPSLFHGEMNFHVQTFVMQIALTAFVVVKLH